MAKSQAEVTEVLKAAAAAIKDAGISKDLQGVAFERALDLLAGKAPRAGASQSGGGGGNENPEDPPQQDTGTKAGKIANVFGITSEEVEEIFDVQEDTLHLTVPRSRLSENRAEAVRQVGLAIVAARQAAGIDADRTHTKHIREAANDLHIANKNKFQGEMAQMASDGWVSSKTEGRGKALKLISQGREQIKQLAPTLLGRS